MPATYIKEFNPVCIDAATGYFERTCTLQRTLSLVLKISRVNFGLYHEYFHSI